MRALIAAAALAGAALSAPAAAQGATAWTEQDRLDGECIFLYAYVGGNAKNLPPEKSAALGRMVIYFVGKIEGRNPGSDLGDLLTIELFNTMLSRKLEANKRCDGDRVTMSQNLIKASSSLRKK